MGILHFHFFSAFSTRCDKFEIINSNANKQCYSESVDHLKMRWHTRIRHLWIDIYLLPSHRKIFVSNSIYGIKFSNENIEHLITLAQLNRAHALSSILYLSNDDLCSHIYEHFGGHLFDHKKKKKTSWTRILCPMTKRRQLHTKCLLWKHIIRGTELSRKETDKKLNGNDSIFYASTIFRNQLSNKSTDYSMKFSARFR